MTLRFIIGAHGTPPHRRAHTQFDHTLTLSQDPAQSASRRSCPSLPPSSRRIACAADDSQSYRAACGETATRREKCERCVGVLLSSSPYLTICVPPLLCALVPRRGAPGVPPSREDRAAPVKGRAPVFNSSQLPCRRCGETNWKFAQAPLGVVLIPGSPVLFCFYYHYYYFNEPFKAMDLRERVSV